MMMSSNEPNCAQGSSTDSAPLEPVFEIDETVGAVEECKLLKNWKRFGCRGCRNTINSTIEVHPHCAERFDLEELYETKPVTWCLKCKTVETKTIVVRLSLSKQPTASFVKARPPQQIIGICIYYI